MSDVRDLIFPMTAGDLVVSAVVLGVTKRGDGAEVKMFEVMHIAPVDPLEPAEFETDFDPIPNDSRMLAISLREQVTLERMEVKLRASTPILISGIRRS